MAAIPQPRDWRTDGPPPAPIALALLFVLTPFAALGCASAHPGLVSDDLACAPEDLRSVWWSGEGGFFGQGELLVDGDGSHALVADDFRAASFGLADGVRAEASRSRLDLADVAGLRVAMPRLEVDALGRNDLAGATDVFAIGTEGPLASIPWVVSRAEGGYTTVLARVGQTNDHVTLLERATRGAESERVFLRRVRVSEPSDEQRHEITSDVSLGASWGPAPLFLVDEAREVAFLVHSSEDAGAVEVLRVSLSTGERRAAHITLAEPAAVLGRSLLGAPETAVLDVALSDDGATLFATTRDGRLRELDAESLEEIGAPRASTLVVANPETYLPTLRSPLAISPHGAWLAQLDAEGRVAISPRAGGAAVSLTSVTSVTVTSEGARTPNAMAVRFLPDGLLVVTDAGVERFRCAE